MRRNSRYFDRTGLTLVEVILAISLTVLVTSGTAVMLRGTSGAQERADQQMELQMQSQWAMDVIAKSLQNAYRLGGKETLLVGVHKDVDGVSQDMIQFFTADWRNCRQGQPESDMKECQFLVMESPQESLPVLICRMDPTRNERPDGGGILQRLAGEVVELSLSYHDGTDWRDDWPEKLHQWPSAIRARLTLASNRQPRQTWTVSRLIGFGHWPTNDTTLNSGGSDEPGAVPARNDEAGK